MLPRTCNEVSHSVDGSTSIDRTYTLASFEITEVIFGEKSMFIGYLEHHMRLSRPRLLNHKDLLCQ